MSDKLDKLDILADLADGPAIVPCKMERYMRDAIHEFRTPLTVISEFAALCKDAIELSVDEGLLLEMNRGKLRLSERGVLFADTVASRLLG